MLFAAGSWFRSEEPIEPTVEVVTESGGVFTTWELDKRTLWDDGNEPEPECNFNNGSVIYKTDFCSHFSLSRLASSSAAKAVDRAGRCAAAFETECILSPEIGMSIPAAFVPRGDGVGMRMIAAPRILASQDERNLKIEDITGRALPRVVAMNSTLHVEFLTGNSRVPTTEQFNGSDAYCVQLLRLSFVPECWEDLD